MEQAVSTRCSKYYAHGLHLYWECNYHQLCLSVDNRVPDGQESSEYGDLCMSRADWIEFAQTILKACEEEEIEPPRSKP